MERGATCKISSLLVHFSEIVAAMVVTLTLIDTEMAHWPALGVKVYAPEAVLLITAGLQVPVIPFGEVTLNVGAVLSVQIFSGVRLKSGVIEFPTVTLNETEVAHCPALGVKV